MIRAPGRFLRIRRETAVRRAVPLLPALLAIAALMLVTPGNAAAAIDPTLEVSPRLVAREDLREAAFTSAPSPDAARAGTAAPSMALAWADVESAAPEALGEVRSRGEVTLADTYRLALAVSLRVGQAREEYLRARADLVTARAQVLPNVSLEDTYFRQNRVTIDSTNAGVSFANTRNEALVRVQQPIFSGLRDHFFIRSSRATLLGLRHGLDDAGRLLYGDVAGLFYDALQSEARVKTLEDTVRVEQERLREIDARREVGLARRTEVLLVQSQLTEDESLLTSARNDNLVARQRLALLAGVPLDLPLRDDVAIPTDVAAVAATAAPAGDPAGSGPGETGRHEGPDGATAPAEAPIPGPPLSPDTDDPVEALLREARENRADLKQAQSAVDAARAQVSFARGSYYPTVGLDATYILDRRNFSEFGQATDWTAEVDFRLPLFDGGRTRASVARSRSTLRGAEIARDDLERQVHLDVEDRWLTLQSGLAQRKTNETRVNYADENFRLIQEEYREGLATNLEVITAQNQLLSARLDLDRQRYQNKLDWVGLRVAQGLLPGRTVPESAGPGGAAR